jgi:zinc transporter
MSEGLPIQFPDHYGLICGFQLRPQASVKQLEWNEVMEVFGQPDSALWLHFNLSDARSRNWIANCDRIPQLAKDLLLASDPHIQLEVLEDSFVSVIGDLYYEFDADPDSLGLLRIYVDRWCMISVRERPLKAIDILRRNLLYRQESIDSPMELMVDLIKLLNDLFDNIVTDLREVVEDMEDRLLKGNFHADRRELSRVRRLLARLHRHLNANRHALTHHLITHFPHWCGETTKLEFQRDLDRLSAIIQDLDLVQERSRLVREEMSSNLQETLNRNLYVLSIVTTIFLPITLITGIFGMNVGGSPLVQNPAGFFWAIFLMVLTLAIAFIVLKRQQFF